MISEGGSLCILSEPLGQESECFHAHSWSFASQQDFRQIIPFPGAFMSFNCRVFLVKEHMMNLCAFKYLSLFDHSRLDGEIYSLLGFHNDQTAEMQNLCGLETYRLSRCDRLGKS